MSTKSDEIKCSNNWVYQSFSCWNEGGNYDSILGRFSRVVSMKTASQFTFNYTPKTDLAESPWKLVYTETWKSWLSIGKKFSFQFYKTFRKDFLNIHTSISSRLRKKSSIRVWLVSLYTIHFFSIMSKNNNISWANEARFPSPNIFTELSEKVMRVKK